MKGFNTITLNEATMMEIIQHYFTNVMFTGNEVPTITSISVDKDYSTPRFVINTSESA